MIEVGQRETLKKIFTVEEVEEYRSLTGDTNPRYTKTPDGQESGIRIVPSDLLMGVVSNLLGTKLPGRGTNWLKQQLTFPEDAFTGEEITAEIWVTSLRSEKNLVNLSSACRTEAGKTVCTGESLVLIKDLGK